MANGPDLQVSPDLLENPLLPAIGNDLSPRSGAVVPGLTAPFPGGIPALMDLTQRLESGGRNIMVIGHPESHASGPWQMQPDTFKRWAAGAGIDVSQWHNAMDAPLDVQQKVAEYGLRTEGVGPWANYNQPLANMLAPYGFKAGGMRPAGHPDMSAPLPSTSINPVVQANSPEAPKPQTAVPLGQAATTPQGPNLLVVMSILKTLMAGTHSFQPVDYDPWAAQRGYRLGSVGGRTT